MNVGLAANTKTKYYPIKEHTGAQTTLHHCGVLLSFLPGGSVAFSWASLHPAELTTLVCHSAGCASVCVCVCVSGCK